MRTRGGAGCLHSREGSLSRTSAARTRVWESSLQAWIQRIGLSKLPGCGPL